MVLRPVGSHSAAVYWRRRIVLLAAILIVVIVIVRACSGGSGTPSAGSGPPSAPSTTTSPPAAIDACAMKNLSASVSPAAATSTAGSPEKFTAAIALVDGQACSLTLTPTQVTWTVKTGSTTVWTDSGCQPASGGVDHTIKPGHSFTIKLKWDGRASAANCGKGSTAAAGNYTMTVQLGSIASKPAAFALEST